MPAPPFNTPEEIRAQAFRISQRARWAAELTRARLLFGNPVAYRTLLDNWYPQIWRQYDDGNGTAGDPQYD